jgi:hypothetical protein
MLANVWPQVVQAQLAREARNINGSLERIAHGGL